jgi:hypothetical protein
MLNFPANARAHKCEREGREVEECSTTDNHGYRWLERSDFPTLKIVVAPQDQAGPTASQAARCRSTRVSTLAGSIVGSR